MLCVSLMRQTRTKKGRQIGFLFVWLTPTFCYKQDTVTKWNKTNRSNSNNKTSRKDTLFNRIYDQIILPIQKMSGERQVNNLSRITAVISKFSSLPFTGHSCKYYCHPKHLPVIPQNKQDTEMQVSVLSSVWVCPKTDPEIHPWVYCLRGTPAASQGQQCSLAHFFVNSLSLPSKPEGKIWAQPTSVLLGFSCLI